MLERESVLVLVRVTGPGKVWERAPALGKELVMVPESELVLGPGLAWARSQ